MDDEAAPPLLTVRVCDSSAARSTAPNRCSTNCAPASATACAWCGRPAWAAATRRRSSRSAMRCTSTPPRGVSPPRLPRAPPTPPPPPIPVSINTAPAAAMGCCDPVSPVRGQSRSDRGPRRLRAARSRRRRLSNRAQMALCAPGAQAPALRGQCRRGRARTFKDRYFLETDRIALSRGC